MKMRFLTNKNLLSQAKIVWKTLVVLILSVLLFAPTPALALDYNGTLQFYVSNAKVEIDSVLASIRKLPNLSYQNGQTTLAEIDSKLQKIQTDAGNRAKDFQKLSELAQQMYEQVLNQINQQHTSKGQFTLLATQETNLPSLTNASDNLIAVDISTQGNWGWYTAPGYSSDANGNLSERDCSGCRFPNIRIGALVATKNNKPVANGRVQSIPLQPGETVEFIFNDGIYSDNVGSQTITYSFSKDDKNYFFSINGKNVTIKNYQKELDSQKQDLTDGIVLAERTYNLYDGLEKRIKLATQKFGTVKEYAEALNSFSDPDVLREIDKLDKFLANLTNNLSKGG